MEKKIINITIREEELHGILYYPSCPLYNKNGEEIFQYPLIIRINGMPGTPPESDEEILAKFLTDYSFAFFTFDHQGVRESSGIFTYFAAQSNIEYIIDEIVQFDLINPILIGLFGESFGGAMALCHCARDKRIKALAIRSPVFDTEMVSNLPFFKDLMRIWTRNKQMRFPQGNVKEMYKEQTSLYNPIKLAPKINVPAFIIGGDSDKILSFDGFKKLYKKLGSNDKQIKIIKGANHNFTNKKNYDVMQELVAEFFKKHLINGQNETYSKIK